MLTQLDLRINRADVCRITGVRPSLGAAGSASPGAVQKTGSSLLAKIAAPGDGRTPAKAGLVINGKSKLRTQ